MRRTTLLTLTLFATTHFALAALCAWASIAWMGRYDPKFSPADALNLDLVFLAGLWTPWATLLGGLTIALWRRRQVPLGAFRAAALGAAAGGAVALAQSGLNLLAGPEGAATSLFLGAPPVTLLVLALVVPRRAGPVAAI